LIQGSVSVESKLKSLQGVDQFNQIETAVAGESDVDPKRSGRDLKRIRGRDSRSAAQFARHGIGPARRDRIAWMNVPRRHGSTPELEKLR
jgi:hypothetical protein